MSTSPIPSRVLPKVLGTLVTQVLSWGVAFLVNIFVPGYLTPSALSTLVLVSSFTAGVGTLLGSGISHLLVREIARAPDRLPEFFWAAIMLRLPMLAAGVLGGVLLSVALGYDLFVTRLIVAGLALLVVSQTNTIVVSCLQGLDNFGRGNVAQLLERVFSAVVQIILVWTRQPLWTFVVLPVVGSMVGLAWSMVTLLPRLRGNSHGERRRYYRPETVRFLYQTGLPLVTGYLLFAVWEPCNQVLLSKLAHVEAGGWYGLTRRLVGTALFIPVALTSVTLPILSRKYKEGIVAFSAAVRQNLRITLLGVLPVAYIFLFASEPVMHLLHYLPKYAGALPVFRIFGGALTIWFLSQVAGSALVASDRQNAIARFTLVAVVMVPCTAGVGIFLADRLLGNGAVGAALSDIVIETFLLVNYFRLLPHDDEKLVKLGFVARVVLASVPQAILFASIHTVDRLWLVPVGVALYLVMCCVLRCILPEEVRHLVAPLMSRFSGRFDRKSENSL